MKCPICSSDMSEPIKELFGLPTIASDCRPWIHGRSVEICSGCGVMHRVVEPAYKDIYDKVYLDYVNYPEPTGRTAKILEFIKDKILDPKRILDIGTGNGSGLEVLSRQFPVAVISGYEPNNSVYAQKPNDKFDLITLFHVFEHVENLHEMLAYIKLSLTDDGHVLIQVPYTAMWPFDLIIADHIWHFNKESLIQLFNKCGLPIINIGNDIIKKEITILAIHGNDHNSLFEKEPKNNSIDWLLSYKKYLSTITNLVAVYGTGPAAAWAGNILGDRVVCYLDDDENRHGEFNGKNVFPPIVCRLPVVMPFPDWQLSEVKKNHPELKYA